MAWVTIQAKVLERNEHFNFKGMFCDSQGSVCLPLPHDDIVGHMFLDLKYLPLAGPPIFSLMLSYHLKMPCSMTFSPISSLSTTGSSRSSGLELGTAQDQGFFNRLSNFLLIEFTLKLLKMNVGIQAFESLNHC